MRVIYDNKVYGAALSVSSFQQGYGTSRLLEKSPAIRLKFDGHDDEHLIMDMGVAVAISGFALYGHNLMPAATITLEGNATNSWGTPSFSRTITWANFVAETFAAVTYRYWRLRLVDTTNTEKLEVGVVYLGTSLDVADVSPDATIPRVSMSAAQYSRSNQLRGTKRLRHYAPTFNIKYVTEAHRKELIAMYEAQDVVDPFILLVWESSLDVFPPLFVAFTNDTFNFQRMAEEGLAYSTSFACREAF